MFGLNSWNVLDHPKNPDAILIIGETFSGVLEHTLYEFEPRYELYYRMQDARCAKIQYFNRLEDVVQFLDDITLRVN